MHTALTFLQLYVILINIAIFKKETYTMPLPLLPQQDFYITHRILPFDYAMPALEASTDHYGMGYVISGDRFTIIPSSPLR